MKSTLARLIDDFQERELPALTRREQKFANLPGKANVVIGMRRTGKTFFCYQEITDLLAAGIARDRIFYLNFEDDHRLGFKVSDYLVVGGFPEVQSTPRYLATEILQSYIDAVLLKDVVERHRVGNITVLKYMIHSICHATGCKLSINKFYNTLKSMSIKCTKNNLYEYLDHLVDAGLFYRVPIHSRSEKARIVNPAKSIPLTPACCRP